MILAPSVEAISNTYTPSYGRYGATGYGDSWKNGYWSGHFDDCSPYFNIDTGNGGLKFDAIDFTPSPNNNIVGEFKEYFGMNINHSPRSSSYCRVDFNWHTIFAMQGSINGYTVPLCNLYMEVYATARVWDITGGFWACNEVWLTVFSHNQNGVSSWYSGQDITFSVSCYASMQVGHVYRLVTSVGGYCTGFIPSWTDNQLDFYLDINSQPNMAHLNYVKVTY